MDGTIAKTVPDRVLAPGYMWMSGTSFSTPVVSAAAAQILARHPGFTPDQVKGALMLAANYLPNVSGGAAGVGEIDAGVASTFDDPPNPNVGQSRRIDQVWLELHLGVPHLLRVVDDHARAGRRVPDRPEHRTRSRIASLPGRRGRRARSSSDPAPARAGRS